MNKINPVQPTSLLAYQSIIETLGERQLEVLKAIDKIEPCNNSQISEYLNLKISSVVGRVFELRQLGMVTQSHTGKCPLYHTTTIFWKRVKK